MYRISGKFTSKFIKHTKIKKKIEGDKKHDLDIKNYNLR